MRTLFGVRLASGTFVWQQSDGDYTERQAKGVVVKFPFYRQLSTREWTKLIADGMNASKLDWLSLRGKTWFLHLDGLRAFVNAWKADDWMTGVVAVEPEIETKPRTIPKTDGELATTVSFRMTSEEIELARSTRVFLSHKGADKPLVRRMKAALIAIGFDPWLDEDDITAGVELHRGILQGMEDSCAAVFFITPEFVDEKFLATEIDYAITQRLKKDSRFAIVTLVFNVNGKKGVVPELLQRYVWKEPPTETDALVEIIRALPICVGEPRWRE